MPSAGKITLKHYKMKETKDTINTIETAPPPALGIYHVGSSPYSSVNNSEVYHMDCVLGMKHYPDKYFDLAIVDPPYGIGRDGSVKTTSKHGGRKAHKFKGWDNSIPEMKYFTELYRVSQNQIIWGANYFTQYLPGSMGWIFWDKGQRICNSDGELAFSSFQKALRVITINRVQLQIEGETFHPTQKPIKLYEWLLMNYAEKGQRILDTHLGSGSSRIAAYNLGFDFTGFEIDKDYLDASEKRFRNHIAQQRLF
jgi:site-specific DNA-methyltransferase (adenine-specific)